MKRGTFITATLAAGGALHCRFALAETSTGFTPNAWVSLEPNGETVITLPMSDIGQGIRTALAMCLADELDAPWERIRVVVADADAGKSKFDDQGIGGSRTMRKNTAKFRQAGASARGLLVAAAATQWGVLPSSCRTRSGIVYATDGRNAPYESLLVAASALSTPADPVLKAPSEFVYIGKPMPLLGAREKSTGRARYSIDGTRPGMLHASLERAPRLGAELGGYDKGAALNVPGVRAIVELTHPPTSDAFPFVPAVAVLADSNWSAIQGRKALRARWTPGPYANVSSADVRTALVAGLDGTPYVGKSIGNTTPFMQSAPRIITAVYENPLQAHVTLEPQNAIAEVHSDRCEVWAPTQSPVGIQKMAAAIAGLPVTSVIVHQALPGGGFGRRSDGDYATEAIVLAKKTGRPVKAVWTREDDIQHDVYRPPHASRVRAVLDARGAVLAFEHRRAGPTIGVERGYARRDAPDLDALDGMIDIQYAFPNYRAEFCFVDIYPVHYGWWRAVNVGTNSFVSESFLDELAHAANADPYQYRRALLKESPRALAVLDRAAERAGWNDALQSGRARGIAFAPYGNTFVAQVAEVSVSKNKVRVERVVCAIDCGMPINPQTIRAQAEGGIVWGIGAALFHEITLKGGEVAEDNFNAYEMPRIGDIPQIDVEIVASSDPPQGVGEAALPALAPAVCNAIYALTGKRIRRLPVRLQEDRA